MAYATVAQFREYLEQIPSGAAIDAKIQAILDRATAIIDTVLGYSFPAAAVAAQTVYGDGTDYLQLPAFVTGSVTGVTTLSNYTVPDYIQQGAALVVERDDIIGWQGGHFSLYEQGWRYPLSGGWLAGVPYTVTANYGYSATPPDVVECCLEIAVRIWRARDAGFSDVVGVEGGGAVGYNGSLPAMVKMILQERIERVNVGVW